MGIAGSCRIGELVKMKTNDVDDRGSVLIVTLPDTKTNKPRVSTIINETAMNGNEISKSRLFINYQNGKCTVQPVRENKIPRYCVLLRRFWVSQNQNYLLVRNFGGPPLRFWCMVLRTSWSSKNMMDSICKKNQTWEKIFGASSTSVLPSVETTMEPKLSVASSTSSSTNSAPESSTLILASINLAIERKSSVTPCVIPVPTHSYGSVKRMWIRSGSSE